MNPVGSMPAKCMDCSGPSKNFTAVPNSAWNQNFLSGLHRHPLIVDDQGVAAFDDDHILVVGVDMGRRRRSLSAGPKRHLASVCAIEDITLNAWSRLIGPGDSVRRILHEFREIVHDCKL